MPVVFRHRGFRFHFFSNEGNPREPVHIHAEKDGVEAKFWIWPEVVVDYSDGFDSRTIRRLADLVQNRRDDITRAWHDFFGESD